MHFGKELLGATVEDQYFNLCRHTWTGYGERYETYREAFDAAVEYFGRTDESIDKVVIETRVKFQYSKEAGQYATSTDAPIAVETLSRSEAMRRSKLTKNA